jgi:hypothetical protein
MKKAQRSRELLATVEAVAHELRYGLAREGDPREFAWCITALREAIAPYVLANTDRA